MLKDLDKELMLRFLTRNYPIIRYKYKDRFKRAIILDNGGVYYLSDFEKHDKLKAELIEVLLMVFNYDRAFTSDVLDSFLPI